MNPSIKIRPAQAEDASFAASMLYLSMEHLADHLFEKDAASIRKDVSNLFARNAGRFGYKLASIAESGNEPVGLLIASRGDELNRLNLKTIPHLIAVLGFMRAIRFIDRGIYLPGGKEADNDELYIGNLGVLPSMQGRSFGSQLLEHAERLAHEKDLKKCSLIAGWHNENARRLYERIGYRVVETVPDEKENLGYYRMVKVLSL